MSKLVNKQISNGFTLIELLVVVSLMSILTIITVSQFNTAKMKARDVQRKADLSAMQKALLMYYADWNQFPAEINGGTTDNEWCFREDACDFKDTENYLYMKKLPVDNKSSNPPYCYVVSADRKSFALFALLENTKDSDCKLTPGPLTPLYQNRCGNYDYCLTYVSPNIQAGNL